MHFDALLAQVRACTLCADKLPLSPRPVLQIHPQARILIAGQAPGRRVHQSGVPFDDASGERLRSWMGISNAQFYDPQQVAILPMGFCYPGSGKSGDLPPRSECALAWRQQLLEHLPLLQLTLVIGQYAQAYHFNDKRNLTERVKHWQEYGPANLPLPHPSPRNNRWLAQNLWFEDALLPSLRLRVAELLDDAKSQQA